MLLCCSLGLILVQKCRSKWLISLLLFSMLFVFCLVFKRRKTTEAKKQEETSKIFYHLEKI